MYGILCATPEELAALRVRLHVDPEPRIFGATQVWTGAGYALALSGIGKVNAASAATLLLSAFKADVLIFSGVAGGLNPALAVGDVLLGTRLAVHDYGYITAGVFTPTASGIIPIGASTLSELVLVAPSVVAHFEHLKTRLTGRLAVRLGTITTADYFLNCPATRDDLHARLGADAIDMESGAVAQIADAWNRPLYVIRTLSDLAGAESHTDYPRLAAMAARNSALCVEELLVILQS